MIRARIIFIFSTLIEMYMKNVYDYSIQSITSIHDETATYAIRVKFAEYGPLYDSEEYELVFKIFVDEDAEDVTFLILNDYGDDCIKTCQDAMDYSKEMIEEENASYKNFLLNAFFG